VSLVGENWLRFASQYLKKGAKVYIEVRLTPDKSTGNPRILDKSDGSPAASYEVNAQLVPIPFPEKRERHG